VSMPSRPVAKGCRPEASSARAPAFPRGPAIGARRSVAFPRGGSPDPPRSTAGQDRPWHICGCRTARAGKPPAEPPPPARPHKGGTMSGALPPARAALF